MSYLEAAFGNSQSADVNLLFNTSALFDCMTARWVKGTRGDWVQVGGFSNNGGIAAPANCGKTEQALLMFSRVVKRIPCAEGQIYESEGTLDIERINEVMQRDPYDTDDFIRTIPSISDLEDAREEGREIDTAIQFVDGQLLGFDKYNDAMHVLAASRAKERKIKSKTRTLPFKYHRTLGDKMLVPIFALVDSGSEAEIDSVEVKLESKGIDDSGAKMTDMTAGVVKTRIFQRLGSLAPKGDIFIMSTASIDKKADMNTMPGMSPPKEMTHMKAGEAIKGVGTSYKKRTSVLWAMNKADTLFKASGMANKFPKYPKNADDNYLGNMDLQANVITALRNKSGPSGWSLPMVRSQNDGIVESATFFETLRKIGREDKYADYGIHVPKQHHFALDLMPEVHFRATTLRELADENPLFMRALEFTYRLKMLFYINPITKFKHLNCTPKELYDGIIAKGHKWDTLLNTRNWFTLLEEEHRFRPQLTEVDLVRMFKEDYVPFWMDTKEK